MHNAADRKQRSEACSAGVRNIILRSPTSDGPALHSRSSSSSNSRARFRVQSRKAPPDLRANPLRITALHRIPPHHTAPRRNVLKRSIPQWTSDLACWAIKLTRSQVIHAHGAAACALAHARVLSAARSNRHRTENKTPACWRIRNITRSLIMENRTLPRTTPHCVCHATRACITFRRMARCKRTATITHYTP